MPVAHVTDVGVFGAVELIGGYPDPLFDEDTLRNASGVRVTEEFTHLLLDRLYLVFTGASLYFTLLGGDGYVIRQ
jgi:hypothetical protein